jgi:hypothetical protein
MRLCCLQEDNFVPTMTTKETLDFYASVILPSSWSSAKKHERVVEVLDAVGLGHGHKTLVSATIRVTRCSCVRQGSSSSSTDSTASRAWQMELMGSHTCCWQAWLNLL